MYNLNDILYEGYGIDDHGRSGVFRTYNKEEILRYAKRSNKMLKDVCIVKLQVVDVISCEEYEQLSLFDL